MDLKLIITALLILDIILVIVRCIFFREKQKVISIIASARPDVERKVYVTLPCGAKVLELKPHEIADTPGTIDRNQPESVREGGVFFQCYGRCPYVHNCSYVKAFADLHLGNDFSLPLERGKRLELKRRNGHRCVALVDESDVEVKTIPLTGVSYLGRAERYTTVPPLFQDVEETRKDD